MPHEESRTAPELTVVTLCGSMRFREHFDRLEAELSLAGHVVLAPAAECPLAAQRIEGGAAVVLGCVSEVPTQGLALIGSGGGSYAAVVGDAVVISGEPIGQGPSISG